MEDDSQIFAALIRLQAMREHSSHELLRKLTQKGFSHKAVQEQIEGLTEQGLQSDQRYAEMAVRVGVSKGHGPQRIRQQMSQQKLSNTLISQAFEQNEIDWFTLAYEVKCKKFGEDIELDWHKKQKQQRFLLNRGFDFEQINHAIQYNPVLDA
ncbi:regulatory protein RecX [Alteromonas oceanisediminis]|uniref:regulatory protein RecX n=1 Tax=Alteromonas oceanisediminis TaxID=2836180 RepID=UPI001BDB6492|nr:regulatory protein RecX [Alteromonas oceanisediminis]MBT0584885.1 recombination regulator RecX [Alteromonas oceanisediminis]